MRRLLFLIPLVFLVAACESPVEPSNVDEANPITITNIINIGGDDDHSGCKDCDDDDDNGPPPNSAPFINPIPTQNHECGDNVNLSITGFDADGDNLTWQWEANSAPRNLTLQSTGAASALISGNITSSSADDSPFTTRIIASDGKAETSTVFLWNVTCEAV